MTMTATQQWRCVYCETWNLVTSPSCLVCERARPEDAVATERTFERSERPPPPPPPPPTAPPTTTISASGRPAVPMTPAAALTDPASIPPSVTVEPDKPPPLWLVPSLIFAIGLLMVAAVVVGLLLTSN